MANTTAQIINFYQELTATSQALAKAARGLKKIAQFLQKTQKIDPSQAWFWTKQWQAKEKEADKDIKKGRFKTFDSAKEAIKYLNS